MLVEELKIILEELPKDYEVRVGNRHIHKETIYEDITNKTIYLN